MEFRDNAKWLQDNKILEQNLSCDLCGKCKCISMFLMLCLDVFL